MTSNKDSKTHKPEQHPANLNSKLDWKFVFHSIGAQLPSDKNKRTPIWVHCPLCKVRRGHIFADYVFGGSWFYCTCCKSGMDLIELAAEVLGTELENATKLLLPNVSDEEISEYILQYPYNRRKTNQFWKNLEKLSPDSDEASRDLLKQLEIKLPPERHWYSRLGKYVSCVRYSDLDPDISALGNIDSPFNSSSYRGTKFTVSSHKINRVVWKNDRLLIAPARDFPGRISSFFVSGFKSYCNQLTLRKQSWRVKPYSMVKEHKTLNISSYGSTKVRVESGFVMDYTLYEGLDVETDLWCFIMLDPLAAIKLQSHHMQTQERPLPIVGAMVNNFYGPWAAWSAWRWRRRNNKLRRKYLFIGSEDEKEELKMLAKLATASYSVQPVKDIDFSKPKIWLNTAIEYKVMVRHSTHERINNLGVIRDWIH